MAKLSEADDQWMQMALREAQGALEEEEVPVGAVVVAGDQVLAKAHNQTERFLDVTAHAEILALTAAEQALGAKFLEDCSLYVSLEPCLMCCGALQWARIGRLVFACPDPKRGGLSLHGPAVLHPQTEVGQGPRENEARQLLQAFFRGRR